MKMKKKEKKTLYATDSDLFSLFDEVILLDENMKVKVIQIKK